MVKKKGTAVIARKYFDFVENSYAKLNEKREIWKKYFKNIYEDDFLSSYQKTTFKEPQIKLKDLILITGPAIK